MASKYIGTIINNAEVIDTHYKLSSTKKSGGTYYVLRCLDCGETFERPQPSVSRGLAKCKCKYKYKYGYTYRKNN